MFRRGTDWLTIGRGNDTLQDESEIIRIKHLIPKGTLFVVDDTNMWITWKTTFAQRLKGFNLRVSMRSTNGKPMEYLTTSME